MNCPLVLVVETAFCILWCGAQISECPNYRNTVEPFVSKYPPRNNTIAPHSPDIDSVRSPAIAAWLQNAALRDLALHETHAACIDARGDLYQWGDGFFGKESSSDGMPRLTLRGKVRPAYSLRLEIILTAE